MCWLKLASQPASQQYQLAPRSSGAQDVEWREEVAGGVTGLRLLLLMEDSRPGSVGRPTHTLGSQANMTIEETMLRQTDFYNLNASMQEQSKVRILRNVRFELC